VHVLQSGLVVNAFGNGAANPFLLLYLHDVRGIPLGLAGLAASLTAATALVVALVAGSLADRRGPRPTMIAGLACSACAFALYPLVHEAWQAFAVAMLAGAGGGTWLTGQSSLVAALTPQHLRHIAFARQRVAANVGLGLGGFVGGLIVAVGEPHTFTRLFLANAATFLVYALVLLLWVPDPDRVPSAEPAAGSYRHVLCDGAFVRLAALNFVFVLAVVSLLNSVFPVFARNEGGLGEAAIGLLFLLNSILIVLFQLPTARALEGHRRMRGLALMGGLFALCWLLVLAGGTAGGSAAPLLLIGAGIVAMSFGECLYDSIQGPLVSDLAPAGAIGRYMAVSGFSWQLGFIVGPALAAAVLGAEPYALWPIMASLCVLASLYALLLERRLPEPVRLTSRRESPGGGARTARRTAVAPAAAARRRP
jgi:MFS family permease